MTEQERIALLEEIRKAKMEIKEAKMEIKRLLQCYYIAASVCAVIVVVCFAAMIAGGAQ